MANTLLMPKATAVWLVDNTGLSFDQIAQFCGLHPLEVKAIADGELAQGHQGHGPDHDRPAQPGRDRQGRRRSQSSPETVGPQGAGARIQAQVAALHAAVEAPGPAQRHTVAGAQPSRTEGRADLAPRRHHQIDHRADPRQQALERQQPGADGSGDAGPGSQIDLDIEVNRASKGRETAAPAGDTLLPASLTERLQPETPKEKDEDAELDANAVFAKLSALKSKPEEE